jgi:UDP:flavonoid glycosyltransferase YjiC (YdhE family)
VANRLNIPNIVLRTSSPSFLLSAFNIPRLQAQELIPLKDSTLEEFVPGLHHLRFKDLPLHKTDFDDMIEIISIIRNLKSVSAILYNTTEHLESSSLTEIHKYDQIPYFPIGPLHKMAPSSSTSLLEEDSSCKIWLDKQAPNSVIYVSLGSLATMDQNELTEMAWGLANSGLFVLWVVRPGSILHSEWVEFLPKELEELIGDRILITKWAPQKEVLAHGAVGGFWTHCGWNSTIETISEGVPVICRPSFGDQYVNSRYLTYVWRVGLECGEDLERGGIEKLIRRLMVDEEGLEMRQRANDIKEKIKICTTKGGSSKNALNDLAEFIMSFKSSK